MKIHHLLYWCEAFRNPQVERTQVPIRYDPYDAGRAWACVNRYWFECHSEYYAFFQGRSERELLLATQELRARRREHARRFKISARQLANFLQSVEAEELLLKQRLHDRQVRRLVSMVEGDAPSVAPVQAKLAEQSGAQLNRSPLLQYMSQQSAKNTRSFNGGRRTGLFPPTV